MIAESEMEFESIDVSEIGESQQTQKKRSLIKLAVSGSTGGRYKCTMPRNSYRGVVRALRAQLLEKRERQCARSRRSYKLGPVQKPQCMPF